MVPYRPALMSKTRPNKFCSLLVRVRTVRDALTNHFAFDPLRAWVGQTIRPNPVTISHGSAAYPAPVIATATPVRADGNTVRNELRCAWHIIRDEQGKRSGCGNR